MKNIAMKNTLLARSSLLLISIVLANAGFAAAPAGTAAPAKLAAGDEIFVKKAASGGMLEVKLGEAAKEKASSQDAKDFAAMMVADHTKANDDLKSIATSKGAEVPTDLNAKDKASFDKLSKLSGAEFDKAYAKDMVKDHKEDIAEFERASKSLKDPDLKAFAEKTLPTLKAHLEHAEKLSGEEKGIKTGHEKKEKIS